MKERFTNILVTIIAFTVLAVVGYFSYDLLVEKITIDQLEAVTDFIRAIAWQTVAVLVVFVFREPISTVIRNIKSVKAVGVEATTQSKDNEVERKIEDEAEETIKLPKDEIQRIAQGYTELQQENLNKDEQIKQLGELLDYAISRAELYEFIYLDGFLVYNTKLALLWIGSIGEVTKDNFYVKFPLQTGTGLVNQYLPEQGKDEKIAILDALLTSYLVSVENEIIRVTPKGNRYVKYLSNRINK